VTRHTQRLYGLALRLLGNSEEAEDAIQEAFIRAYTQLASFRGSASFATWLYRITLNVCRDQLRRRQVRQRTAELARVDQLWADERYTVDPE
jgi:RNA polymerase sigma-70 factor (ECF subfamily)